ncbi:hypothetical protein JCM2811A_38040 [Methylorubrum rhodinum]
MGVSGRHTVDLSKIRSGSSAAPAAPGTSAAARQAAASNIRVFSMVPPSHIIDAIPSKPGRKHMVSLSPGGEGR